MENFELHKTQTIDFQSEFYPAHLKAIKNPPKILHVRGNLDLLKKTNGVSVVGTRDATVNGLKITDRLTRFLVDKECVIVSGLALGIDVQAHISCLEAKGNTIAVLAHGLDKIYPAQNNSIARSILASNGLWVSEHPDGTAPQKQFFVLRNRIQVGLSRYSIVVEADVSSGTTSHAKFCVEAGHQLFAILPEEPNTLGLNSAGPKMMVDVMGAIALKNRDDYELLEKGLAI